MSKESLKDFKDRIDDLNESYKKILDDLSNQESSLINIFNRNEKIRLQNQKAIIKQQQLNALIDEYNIKLNEGYSANGKVLSQLRSQIRHLESENEIEASILEKKKEKNKIQTDFNILSEKLIKYLAEQDAIIKKTNISIGISSQKAAQLRSVFYDINPYITSIGAGLQDASTVITAFANETGRSRVLSGELLKNIITLGKATGVGVDGMSALASKMELLGFIGESFTDSLSTYITDFEIMGVNTTKVINNLVSNFDTLQRFTFRNGVDAMFKMSGYAEKMRIDMNSFLGTADKFRGLENVIQSAAELQVMGGNFANLNPLEAFYLARNEPEKLMVKINEMTKGIVSLKKNSEGFFEKFISPADMDRLEQVEKSLGLSNGELRKQARVMFDIQKIRQTLSSSMFTDEQLKAIEGVARLESKTGKYVVDINDKTKNLMELTANDAKRLVSAEKSIEKRAEMAMDFEKALSASLDTFKATLLPILEGFNEVTTFFRDGIILPMSKLFSEIPFLKDGLKTVGYIGMGIISLSGIVGLLRTSVVSLITPIKSLLSLKNINLDVFGNNSSNTGGAGTRNRTSRRTARATGSQLKGLATGAGVGLAGLGVGGGVALAAEGINSIAESLNKLDSNKVDALAEISWALSGIALVGGAAATAIAYFGSASTYAALGLAAFGAAAVGVGFGVKLAGQGIAIASGGLSELITVSKDSKASLFELAAGLGAVYLAMSLGGVAAGVGSIIGGGGMMLALKGIASYAKEISTISDSISNIKVNLTANKEDFNKFTELINSIKSFNIKDNSSFNELKELLSKPLKVEFDTSKKVGITTNLVLNIDGKEFMKELKVGDYALEYTANNPATKQ